MSTPVASPGPSFRAVQESEPLEASLAQGDAQLQLQALPWLEEFLEFAR